MTINSETFESLRTLLEAESGPAYASLRALFSETCPGCFYDEWSKIPSTYLCGCNNGYISCLPYWQAAPEGALPGAMLVAGHNVIPVSIWLEIQRNMLSDQDSLIVLRKYLERRVRVDA